VAKHRPHQRGPTDHSARFTVMPVMALYLVASKHFIRGIAMTGIKG